MKNSKICDLISNLSKDNKNIKCKKLLDLVNIVKGTQLNKNLLLNDCTLVPVINGGKLPSGYWGEYNFTKNLITISQGGASAGYVQWQEKNFWAGAHCYVVINLNKCNYKYIYYFLKDSEEKLMKSKFGAGIPSLNKFDILHLSIPIPSIEIQNEIVRILDKYTELEKELEKELELRTKQYEYYRDRLFLNLYKKKLIFKSVNEVCNFNKKSKLGVKNIEKLDEKGEIPFFTSGNRILYVNNFLVQDENIFMNDGGTADFKFYKGNANYSDHIISFKSKDKKVILNKFIFYFLLYKKDYINDTFFVGAGLKNISKKRFSDYEIPVPSIDIQKRIINILDRFLNIIKDLEQGIPKQIKLTHKEYLYYRNKLLNFEEKSK